MRYVVSVVINDQERLRRAVYADTLDEVMKMDCFTDKEFDLFEQAIHQKSAITICVEESCHVG